MATEIQTLREMVEAGARQEPRMVSRLEKAACIVVLRTIEKLGERSFRVPSEDGLRSYTVENGSCDCHDYVGHGGGDFYCKHRLAVGMLARLNGNARGS